MKAVSPPKTPKVKAEPEPVAEPEGEPAEPEGEPAEVAVAVDYTRVKAAVMKVSQEKGRQAAVDLLAMPGVEDLDLPLPHHLELARAADLF